MDPLASTTAVAPAAIQAVPAAWIASGAVTPVVGSPAAAAATAWVPQPVALAGPAPQGSGSLLDAIASTILGASPTPTSPGDAALAQQQLAEQQQLAMQQQAMQQQAMQQQVVAPPPMPEVGAAGAPVAAVQPVVQPAIVVPQTVAPHVTAQAVATPPQDPTLIGSVTGALAGFASATGRAVADVAGAGVSRAKRVGSELWAGVRNPRAVHVSQVPSKYNSAPASGNRDCGPASVVMTLKLLGKKIPGAAANAAPQRLINRVRQLAGNVANTASTTNHELARALRAAGTKTREIADAASIRQAVLAGKPVILNGNPRNPGAYGPKFNARQMTPYDGAHWIVVSGFDDKAGKYIINDPLSKVGPVKVTPAQLEAYRGGSLGIEVEG